MKKGFILFTALFLLSTFTAFAAVKAVKDGDVVKVTWTYEGADAVSVGLVGDFQGWNLAGALPMTKDANGVWTITLDGKADSEYKYKFNVDGEWTEDPTAPEGTDDGFGGVNGYAIVANLLNASGATGAAVAPAARGFNFGVFDAAWVNVGVATKNAVSGVKGAEINSVTLNHKAYVKADGYIFPKLLYTAFEFKWYDGAINLYKKELVYNKFTMQFDPTVTTTLTDGAKNVGNLAWSMFQPFGMTWPDTKGKVRIVLEFNDINTKVSHAVGWSKTTKQNVGGLFLTYFEDPDSNAGVTEVFPINAFDFGGATLDYLVNLDKSGGNYKTGIYLFPTVAGVNIETGATLDTGTADLAKFGEKMISHLFLGAKTSMDALTIAAQGKYVLTNDAATTLTDAYFGTLKVGYKVKDFIDAFGQVSYAGTDAKVSYNDTNADNGLAGGDYDGKFRGVAEATLTFAPLTVTLGNTFTAAYKDFTKPTDSVKVGSTFAADGLTAGITANLAIPVADGAKFAVSDVTVNATVASLVAALRWVPAQDFSTNEIRLRSTYALTSDIGLAAGLNFVQDAIDTNDPLGLTLGFNMMTPFAAVKSPVFFATADYNFSAMDGDDNHQMSKIDSDDFKIVSGAALRTGLRWNF